MSAKFISLLLLGAAIFFCVPYTSAQQDAIAVVVNPANSTADMNLGDCVRSSREFVGRGREENR
jgi:hypothetical protein